MEKIILFGLNNEVRKLVQIYGMGNSAFNLNKWIVAIADNNPDLWGTMFGEKQIINPLKISEYKFDKIVICPRGKAEALIREQLLGMSIPEDKLSYLYEWLTLPQNKINNCRMIVGRNAVLSHFDKGLTIAEVGVAFGAFSYKLINIMQPKKFYAIDYFFADNPFLENTSFTSLPGGENFKKSGLTMIEYYKSRFSKDIESGSVDVKQGLSWEVLARFEDDTFDYIYLDAAHDYESVTKDIEVIKRKVKKGGIIQFNDYGYMNATAKEYAYGVLPAVNKFLWDNDCEVLFYCINSNGLNDLVVKIY